MHLLWKPELLPLKKAAALGILSNDTKLANQLFILCQLLPVGDREIPGLNILGPGLYIWHKGRAGLSDDSEDPALPSKVQ